MKKIISILFAVLVINCLGMEAKTTEKFYKKNSKVSAKVNNDSINTQTAIADPTNFIVESKVVKIPAHNSFQPLLKHFPKTSRKIKSIKIYYITGLKGEIGYDLKDFMKASSLRQAKKSIVLIVLHLILTKINKLKDMTTF